MNADEAQRLGRVSGVARRGFLRELEQRLASPASRLVLRGPDADLIADALVLAWPHAIEVGARRTPFGFMHALAARLCTSVRGPRGEMHRSLREAWSAQSELIVVRDARRLDAESRLWLDSLAELEGASVLVVDDDAPSIAGYGVARVPRLDADAIGEWSSRPEIIRRLVEASNGSEQALSQWLIGGGAPIDPKLGRAAEWIAAADGIDPDELHAETGVRASDAQWARAGVRRVRGELRASVSPSVEACLDWAERAWSRGRILDAMRLWRDADPRRADAHLDEALQRLVCAPACAASLLADAEPSTDRLRRRTELLRAIGRWGEARSAARAWHDLARSDDSAFELAWLLAQTGRAAEARPSDVDSARWCALRAEIAFQRGELDRAADEVRKVADAVDVDRESRLCAMQTWAKLSVDDDHESLRRYDAYLEAAADDLRHASYAASGRAVALIRMRRVDEAIESLQRGAELAERADDVKARALAHHNLAVALHLRDRYAEARKEYATALRWLRALSHSSSMARCAYNLGELYEQLGAHDRAAKMAELGAQLAGPNATPASTAEGALLRGRALLALERVDAAEAALESVEHLTPLLDTSRRAGLAILRARVDVAAGRIELALERLGAIDLDLPATRRAELEVARARALRAYHGPLGRELETAERALRHARESGSRHWILESLRVVVGAHRSRGGSAMPFADEAREIERELAAAVPPDLLGAWEERRRDAPVGVDIIGRSARLHEALELARRVAPTRCTVLLRGESGTGKELLAEAIHRGSGRRAHPMVRVSCAALVESLLLSELFGHERGAFTGATERRRGRFELADGGTLFLDEVGELSPTVQAALLRVLQDRTFERVGGAEPITVDVRVIAATHRDLEAMVREGTFRADLYYRLNEVGVELPPLRERRDDIPFLVEHVLRRLAHEQGIEPKAVSLDAMRRLQRFDWPGNVRQLENVVQSAALFAVGPVLQPADFSLPRGSDSQEPTEPGKGDDYARLARGEISLRDLKKELERQCVARALADCEGNITKAAELLGMKRPRVSQLVKEYGLRDEPDGWKEK